MNDWIVRAIFFSLARMFISAFQSLAEWELSGSARISIYPQFSVSSSRSLSLSPPRCLSLALVFMRNNYNEYKIKINIYYVCSDRYVCARPSSVIHNILFAVCTHTHTVRAHERAHTVSIEWVLYISASFYCYFNDLVLCVISHFEWAHWIDFFLSSSLRFVIHHVFCVACFGHWQCDTVTTWTKIGDSQPLITIIPAI